MKNIVSIFTVLFLSMTSFGQIDFKTGDAELNAELNSINAEAKLDLGAFKGKLLNDFGIDGAKAEILLKKMEPAEVLLSGRLKDLLGISIDIVVDSYDRNKSKGWGAIAKDLGIKPGSAEFHALKGKTKKQNGKRKSNGKGKVKGKGKAKS